MPSTENGAITYIVVNSDEEERLINHEIAEAHKLTTLIQGLSEYSKLDTSRLGKLNTLLSTYNNIQVIREGDVAKLPINMAVAKFKQTFYRRAPIAALATELITGLYDIYGPQVLAAHQTYVNERQATYERLCHEQPEHMLPWLEELEPSDHRRAHAVEFINYKLSHFYQHMEDDIYDAIVPRQVKKATHALRDSVREFGDQLVVESAQRRKEMEELAASLPETQQLPFLSDHDPVCPLTSEEVRVLGLWLFGDSALKYAQEQSADINPGANTAKAEQVAPVMISQKSGLSLNDDADQVISEELLDNGDEDSSRSINVGDYTKGPPHSEPKAASMAPYIKPRDVDQVEVGVQYSNEHGDFNVGVGGNKNVLLEKAKNQHQSSYLYLPQHGETVKIVRSENSVRAEIKGKGIDISAPKRDVLLLGPAEAQRKLVDRVLVQLTSQERSVRNKLLEFIINFEKSGLKKWNSKGPTSGRQLVKGRINQLYRHCPDLKEIISKEQLIKDCENAATGSAVLAEITQQWRAKLGVEVIQNVAKEQLSKPKQVQPLSSDEAQETLPSIEEIKTEVEEAGEACNDVGIANSSDDEELPVSINEVDADEQSQSTETEASKQYQEVRPLKITQLCLDAFFDTLKLVMPEERYRECAADIQQIQQICRNLAVLQFDSQHSVDTLPRILTRLSKLLFKDGEAWFDFLLGGLDCFAIYSSLVCEHSVGLPSILMMNILPRLYEVANPVRPTVLSENPISVFMGEVFNNIYGNLLGRYAVLHGETVLREFALFSAPVSEFLIQALFPAALAFSICKTSVSISDTLYRRKISNILFAKGIHVDLLNSNDDNYAKTFYKTWFDALQKKNNVQRHAVPADGNCLFHAISYYTPENNRQLRQLALEYEESHREDFMGFFSGFIAFEYHIMQLRRQPNPGDSATWGGEHEIRALELVLNRHIIVYNEQTDALMRVDKTIVNPYELKNPIFVSFNPVTRHYSALLVRGESFCEVYFSKRLNEQRVALVSRIEQRQSRCDLLSNTIIRLRQARVERLAVNDQKQSKFDTHIDSLKEKCNAEGQKIQRLKAMSANKPAKSSIAKLDRAQLLIWAHNARRTIRQQVANGVAPTMR